MPTIYPKIKGAINLFPWSIENNKVEKIIAVFDPYFIPHLLIKIPRNINSSVNGTMLIQKKYLYININVLVFPFEFEVLNTLLIKFGDTYVNV